VNGCGDNTKPNKKAPVKLTGACYKILLNYILAAVSTIGLSAFAGESIVVLSTLIVVSIVLESASVLDELAPLQATIDTEMAKAKKPNLNAFFIVVIY
jgi:hypothetical protein